MWWALHDTAAGSVRHTRFPWAGIRGPRALSEAVCGVFQRAHPYHCWLAKSGELKRLTYCTKEWETLRVHTWPQYGVGLQHLPRTIVLHQASIYHTSPASVQVLGRYHAAFLLVLQARGGQLVSTLAIQARAVAADSRWRPRGLPPKPLAPMVGCFGPRNSHPNADVKLIIRSWWC